MTSLMDNKIMTMNMLYKNRRFTLLKGIAAAFAFIILVSGCKKEPNEPEIQSSVEIAGLIYPTVKVGSQEWTASNYQGAGGITYNSPNTKPEYGKYYSWAEVQTISIPVGWRIPTVEDYVKLAEAQGVVFSQNQANRQEQIKKLISKTSWKTVSGNNASGFNAFPGGYALNNAAPEDGDIAEFWTNTGITFSIQEIPTQNALRVSFYNNSNSPEYRFNLRLVRDL